ncbi:MAG: hypothetical protein AB7L13_18770 [Acidimicrobiia bacterium]
MKFYVDAWDPSYGSPLSGDDPADSQAEVDPSIEIQESLWRPLPGEGVMRPVVFVDGVRRIDARVWIESADATLHPGLCASWAAGAVLCDGRATVIAAAPMRGLFTAGFGASPIVTRHGVFDPRPANGDAIEQLSSGLQDAMGADEIRIAAEARVDADGRGDGDLLVVVDGPLGQRTPMASTVGMVKSERAKYLDPHLDRMVNHLAPGERTPVFAILARFNRYSWYVRLPGGDVGPRTGVVRCECSASVGIDDAVALADAVTGLLPKYASERHKDPRAPQNLYPIAGLERELRRRLGDQHLVYRALRAAAHA